MKLLIEGEEASAEGWIEGAIDQIRKELDGRKSRRNPVRRTDWGIQE